MPFNRLEKQLSFIKEIDKLKNIFRQSYISNGSRRENDAEHSWHIALMTIILSEHSNEKNLNVLKVIKMLLIHDIVEIDAGDTFVYDEEGYKDKSEREQKAAQRIFSLLPDDQKDELMNLWLEFEKNESPEANFANALDRVQPILLNYINDGRTWKEHGIKYDQVFNKNQRIGKGSDKLWDYIQKLFHEAKTNNFFS